MLVKIILYDYSMIRYFLPINISLFLVCSVAPLVKIKQAINKIKTETQQMDIRIGVVEHILLQAKLREKTNQPRRIEESETYKGFWKYTICVWLGWNVL